MPQQINKLEGRSKPPFRIYALGVLGGAFVGLCATSPITLTSYQNPEVQIPVAIGSAILGAIGGIIGAIRHYAS